MIVYPHDASTANHQASATELGAEVEFSPGACCYASEGQKVKIIKFIKVIVRKGQNQVSSSKL